MIDGVDAIQRKEVAVDKPRLSEVLFGDLGKREFSMSDEGQDEILGTWLLNKQQEVTKKYGLPDRSIRASDTGGYLRQLYLLAEQNGTEVVEGEIGKQRELGDLSFDEESNTINIPKIVDQANSKEWVVYASNFAHELVHALQHARTPDMPIEEMELEAYVGVNKDPRLLNEKWLQGVLVYEVSVSSSYYRRMKGLEIPWR